MAVHERVLVLPPRTRVLAGRGAETTIGDEQDLPAIAAQAERPQPDPRDERRRHTWRRRTESREASRGQHRKGAGLTDGQLVELDQESRSPPGRAHPHPKGSEDSLGLLHWLDGADQSKFKTAPQTRVDRAIRDSTIPQGRLQQAVGIEL